MNDVVIRAEGLSKRYRIGEREQYYALRDAVPRWCAASFRRLAAHVSRQTLPRETGSRDRHLETKHIWALSNVSFDVHRSEIVGVIGRNGSGKSTLLKLLSQVTRPTSGQAFIRGRVGSLLEVGTGFHPELSGRENIYLNGAMLGMSKTDIRQRFDEIVDFADVSAFLDTPVKRYSSGMQVRLAFSVAAHLEAEIMLVDEVLAVGDVAFQRKCLGKIGNFANTGRTVIVVSHQMNQIRRLCAKVLWLEDGKMRQLGGAADTVSAYEASAFEIDAAQSRIFRSWEVLGQGFTVTDGVEPVSLKFVVDLPRDLKNGHFGVALLNNANSVVAGWGFDDLWVKEGKSDFIITLPSLPVAPGTYALVCSIFDDGNNLTGGELLESWSAAPFLIVATCPLTHPQDAWSGVLNLPANLRINDEERVYA